MDQLLCRAPAGAEVCNATKGTPLNAEVCNYQDDTCNGKVDNGFINSAGKYHLVTDCGSCGNDCGLYWLPSPAIWHVQPTCNITPEVPQCDYECTGGYADLDKVPDNGCEFLADAAAIYVSTLEHGGKDSNSCGHFSSPCATIAKGIQRAGATASKTKVLVSDGVFEENITLTDGVSVYGGHSHLNWIHNPDLNITLIKGKPTTALHQMVIQATGIKNKDTSFEGFHIEGAYATKAGGNSYVFYIKDCTSKLKITGNLIVAGKGGDGVRGGDGGDGAGGKNGAQGNKAKDTGASPCSSQSNSGGSGGGLKCATTTVNGGNGGTTNCAVVFNAQQSSGAKGASGGGNGGVGGYNSRIVAPDCGTCNLPSNSQPMIGSDGSPGATGGHGNGGSACTAVSGKVAGGHWGGNSGAVGASGDHGRGGGGGGAGGGVQVVQSSGNTGNCCSPHGFPGCNVPEISACVCAQDPFCCNNYWDSQCVGEVTSLGCGSCGGATCDASTGGDDLGGSGGGGGSGACGGTGGGGGTAGGGAFSVFVLFTNKPANTNAVPKISGNIMRTGAAGSGGDGGNGGVGGVGGEGGSGGIEGINSYSTFCASKGGYGGKGGDGGHGGGGGGGCGGSSYGVYVYNSGSVSISYQSGNDFEMVGDAGQGGQGGSSLSGKSGNPGNPGEAVKVKVVP